MGVSAGGGLVEPAGGVDPDEVRPMYVPDWILNRLPNAPEPRRVETRVYELVQDRFMFVLDDAQSAHREPTPVWVQFAACAVLADSGARSMRGRYGDLGEVLDALRDDVGARDAVRAACMLGGFPAVRQFVASMRAEAQERLYE